MKRFLIILIVTSFSLNALLAQDRTSDRIENNLKLLGRKIEQIRVLAERYENQEALNTIQSAQEDFNAAIDLLKEWNNNKLRLGLLEQARAKYQSANLKADLASRILLFKPAANLLTELERLIQQAESVAQGNDANDLQYYLNKARNYYKHAQNAFASNRYLRGHEYLKIAKYFAEKVINLARGNRNTDRTVRFEELKNNIQMLLTRVSADIDENDILSELYKNVEEYLRRATNAYTSGNINQAFSNLQIAERLTHRMIDLSEENNENTLQQRIQQEYQSLNRYLSTLRIEFERENKQSRVLDKAEEFYIKAGQNIDNRQYQQAATNLKLAQRMALRAFSIISSENKTVDSENLQSRINEIQRLMNLQQNRIENQQNNRATILFEQAKEFFRLGQQAYEHTEYPKASYYFNITLRILHKNENILKAKVQNDISGETVLKDLNQTEQLINRLKLNESLDASSKTRISVLENLLIKARNAFDSGDYVIAKEIVDIVQNQLTNMPNN